MKSKKYLEFKEKYLQECCLVFYEEVCSMLEEQKEVRIAAQNQQMKQVLDAADAICRGTPVEIGCIQMSLLLSSIEKNEPEFMYEVYDKDMDYGTLLFAQTARADWVLTYWKDLREWIEHKISELNWEQYLGAEAVHTLMYEGMEGLILILAFTFKYDYFQFLPQAMQNIANKKNGFFVSFGEYRGWKKILYQYVEEKDIFQESWEKEFSFMRFTDLKYEDKRFSGQKLDSAAFTDCVFLHTTFSDVDLKDAVFENCVFRECTFTGCRLSGCEFRRCDMQRIEWNKNLVRSGIMEKPEELEDVCRKTGFYQTLMHKHTFTATNLAECELSACDLEDVREDCE